MTLQYSNILDKVTYTVAMVGGRYSDPGAWYVIACDQYGSVFRNTFVDWNNLDAIEKVWAIRFLGV